MSLKESPAVVTKTLFYNKLKKKKKVDFLVSWHTHAGCDALWVRVSVEC